MLYKQGDKKMTGLSLMYDTISSFPSSNYKDLFVSLMFFYLIPSNNTNS